MCISRKEEAALEGEGRWKEALISIFEGEILKGVGRCGEALAE